MSANLTFIDNQNNFTHPWECQCVRPLSSDPFERQYGMHEDCGCPERGCNMSNRNTRIVLSALGFNTDFENEPPMLPQELHAACNRFLTSEMAEYVDNGFKNEVSQGEQGCVVIEYGLPAYYITNRIKQIKSLCEAAMLDGATRCYFS